MSEGKNTQGNSAVYREKAMNRISSPESLNDYIRVTTPSVWIVLGVVIALLVGILGWTVFGTVEARDAAGNVNRVHPITYVTN